MKLKLIFGNYYKIYNLKGENNMNTGFKSLDEIIEINKGDLVIVASRPAMGKTAFVSTVANYVLNTEKEPVLFWELEEEEEKIKRRLVSLNSMIEMKKIEIYNNQENKLKELSEEDINRIIFCTDSVNNLPIYILDKPTHYIGYICSKSQELKKERNIKLIIIDYLQLIKCNVLTSRENQITEILRRLKLLAQSLDIPIIVTSELSKKCENDKSRLSKRPLMEDLTNSKNGIYSYVDKVLFIYRDSYYNKCNKSNITELIIAKDGTECRKTANIQWIPEYLKFSN